MNKTFAPKCLLFVNMTMFCKVYKFIMTQQLYNSVKMYVCVWISVRYVIYVGLKIKKCGAYRPCQSFGCWKRSSWSCTICIESLFVHFLYLSLSFNSLYWNNCHDVTVENIHISYSLKHKWLLVLSINDQGCIWLFLSWGIIDDHISLWVDGQLY